MEAQGFPVIDQPFDLGDVSFHSGWIFHRAGPNVATTPRAVMTVIYMDSAMTLATPKHPFQKKDWERWCAGAVVGQVIDTPTNPLLYRAGENRLP